MAAYYNEHDAKTAAWLRELIKAGLIADGEVDTRSIVDVQPDDVRWFTQCHFFAGIGGWSQALRLAGWPDDRAVWTGSCPCQPFSDLGTGKGFADDRDLWPDWFELIRQCRPAVVFGEQVARSGGSTWLARVQACVEREHFAFGAANIPACGVGAPQKSERFWFVAVGTPEGERWRKSLSTLTGSARDPAPRQPAWSSACVLGADGTRRRVESGSFTLAHGLPARVGRLRGYGNAIVPQVAAAFIEAYLSIGEPVSVNAVPNRPDQPASPSAR